MICSEGRRLERRKHRPSVASPGAGSSASTYDHLVGRTWVLLSGRQTRSPHGVTGPGSTGGLGQPSCGRPTPGAGSLQTPRRNRAATCREDGPDPPSGLSASPPAPRASRASWCDPAGGDTGTQGGTRALRGPAGPETPLLDTAWRPPRFLCVTCPRRGALGQRCEQFGRSRCAQTSTSEEGTRRLSRA